MILDIDAILSGSFATIQRQASPPFVIRVRDRCPCFRIIHGHGCRTRDTSIGKGPQIKIVLDLPPAIGETIRFKNEKEHNGQTEGCFFNKKKFFEEMGQKGHEVHNERVLGQNEDRIP